MVDRGEQEYSRYTISVETGFMLHRSSMMSALAANGFSNIATRLAECSSVTELREVLDNSLDSNKLTRLYKSRLRTLGDERVGLSEQAALYEHNRTLSAVKAEHKAVMRILRGAQAYLHLPELFRRAAITMIDDLQNKLETKAFGTLEITLDPTYDSAIDSNHGVSSGDCTEGGLPLPFGTDIPAHNVKVFQHEFHDHLGNIYFLDTETVSGERTWHLDAIQIPNFDINWSRFPETLVATLQTAAERAKVRYITINRLPHHISNYDYIRNAFLEYLGVDTSSDDFNNLQDPESFDAAYANVRTIVIKVPEEVYGYNQFQATDDSQLILWQNKRTTEDAA